jgi:hypothetical protein
MASRLGTRDARIIADLHEECHPNPPQETAMDLFNNAWGRTFGLIGRDCAEACRESVDDSTLQTSLTDNTDGPGQHADG